MTWIENASKALEKAFKNKPFPASDALAVFKKTGEYRAGTTYRVLIELEKRGSLEKLGRGVYRIAYNPAKRAKPEAPEYVERLAEGLENAGIRAQISGLPVLSNYVNMIPRRLIYLVYSPRGAGEAAAEFIEKKGKVPLLNPSLEEIMVAMDTTEAKDIAVIREIGGSNKLTPVASIEKAVVDFYFESTRKKIPFPESEAARIISNALSNAAIDIKSLLRAASRRAIRGEIEAILFALRPETRLGERSIKFTPAVKAVLAATRGI